MVSYGNPLPTSRTHPQRRRSRRSPDESGFFVGPSIVPGVEGGNIAAVVVGGFLAGNQFGASPGFSPKAIARPLAAWRL